MDSRERREIEDSGSPEFEAMINLEKLILSLQCFAELKG